MPEDKTKEIRISIPVPEDFLNLFVPPAAAGRLVQARKEVLLAVRALIDSRIEALERKDNRKAEPKKKIKVE